MGQEQIAPTLLMVHLCVQPPLPIEHVDGESTENVTKMCQKFNTEMSFMI